VTGMTFNWRRWLIKESGGLFLWLGDYATDTVPLPGIFGRRLARSTGRRTGAIDTGLGFRPLSEKPGPWERQGKLT